MTRFTLTLLFFASYSIFAKEPPGKFIGPRDVDVKDFCTTPSGSYVYTAVQNRITLYEIFSGKQINTFQYKHTENIRSIALTSDSTFLIAGTDQGILLLQNLLDNKVDSIKLSNFPVTSVTINAFNSRIASGTSDGEIILTDISGGSMKSLSPHDDVVTDLEFSNDGTLLLSSCMDGRIVVTDLSEATVFYCLTKKSSPCRDISINEKTSSLLASYDNGKVYKWNIKADKAFVFDRGFPHRGWTTGVTYHRDNYTWASCTSSGNIKINTAFGSPYKTKIEGIATRVEFSYEQDPMLLLLVSVYKGGLILLSAKNM